MSTALKLGPEDHGKPLSYQEHMAGDYVGGYHYELIDGKLYVSPEANLTEYRVENWLYVRLLLYSVQYPDKINFVAAKARVFLPDREETTIPEPDIAAYRGFPRDRPIPEMRWQDVSPLLVVEMLSAEDPDKDLVRNVELYRQVPSIKEYWILDNREDPDRPTMLVYRRSGRGWREIEVGFGETYRTRLLPGFELVLDPHN
jgi:Uma2 family endonuclease